MALWLLQRVAPIVAVDPPDGIVLDSTGTEHLHGGEPAMLEALLGRLVLSGIAARAAIADSLGATHALARHAARPTWIAPPGHDTAVLTALPLEALRLPAQMAADLRVLGFARIGDLLAQPRAPLTRRFGPELGRRLDQTTGVLAEPLEPIGAAETIARSIGKLVHQLCAALEAKDLGARRLDLLCHRVDNRIAAVRVGMAMPVRDAKRLTRLLCDRIETIDPGFGIEVMMLTATIAEPLARRQIASALVEEVVPDIADLVDTLANRVGGHAAYRAVPVASDVPERSVARVAAIAPGTGCTWPGHWPRPARLLPWPEPIETLALRPDHPPTWFTWRGIRRRVKRADGPERVFGEWWDRDAELATVRDYFRVEDEAGERYWLYRAGDGEDAATGPQRWFLHGVFG